MKVYTGLNYFSFSDTNGNMWSYSSPANTNNWAASVPNTIACSVTPMTGSFKKSNDASLDIADAQKVTF